MPPADHESVYKMGLVCAPAHPCFCTLQAGDVGESPAEGVVGLEGARRGEDRVLWCAWLLVCGLLHHAHSVQHASCAHLAPPFFCVVRCLKRQLSKVYPPMPSLHPLLQLIIPNIKSSWSGGAGNAGEMQVGKQGPFTGLPTDVSLGPTFFISMANAGDCFARETQVAQVTHPLSPKQMQTQAWIGCLRVRTLSSLSCVLCVILGMRSHPHPSSHL